MKLGIKHLEIMKTVIRSRNIMINWICIREWIFQQVKLLILISHIIAIFET